MQKGFTLIELLIVMVIVGVLVAVALPQYKRTLERGRALEGLAIVRAAADQANAQYILSDNFTYPNTGTTCPSDLMKNNDFGVPSLSRITVDASGMTITIQTQRDTSSGWDYLLSADCKDGEIIKIYCEDGFNTMCAQLDMPRYENLLNRN